ncbi:hypothetical protein [Paraburkholderia sp. C35]|uniref:hypothetical protein n=1 Tax=Paraburkholderia sp. C35 TaxID=2126993 RepID=UPI000D698554|nr:hypothetical protein [Paraburkholderia sp. C35]
MSAIEHQLATTETQPVFAEEIALRLSQLSCFLKAEATRLSAVEHLFPENSGKARALNDDAASVLQLARQLQDRAGERIA